MSAVRVIYTLGIGWGGHTSHMHAKNAGGVWWSGAPPAFESKTHFTYNTYRHQDTHQTHHITYNSGSSGWLGGRRVGWAYISHACNQGHLSPRHTLHAAHTYIKTHPEHNILHTVPGGSGGAERPQHSTPRHTLHTHTFTKTRITYIMGWACVQTMHMYI